MELLGKKKDKFTGSLFYLGLTIELFILLVDKSALHNSIEGQLFRITVLLFSLKVLFTKYSLKEWIWMIAIGALGVVVYNCTSDNVIIRVVVFIVAMKGMDIRRIMKYVLWITLMGSIIISLLAFAGVLGSVSIADEYRKGIIENRYCFGMGHPNAAHCMLFMIILLILYVYKEKMTHWKFIVLLIANGIFFYFTDSKTGMGITAMAILAAWVLKSSAVLQKAKWIYMLGILSFIFCIGISVWAAKNSIYTWHDPFLMKMDTVFSGRMINLYWDTNAHAGALESWTLFSDPSHMMYYFDMGWVRMFYWFGVIPGSIFALLHIFLIWECFKKEDYMGMIMIVALSVYTILEAHIISVYLARNYLLFLFGAYWSEIFHASGGREDYLWKVYKRTVKGKIQFTSGNVIKRSEIDI